MSSTRAGPAVTTPEWTTFATGSRRRRRGFNSRSSAPMRRRNLPSRTTPACSCGWLCSGTTPPSSSSSAESINALAGYQGATNAWEQFQLRQFVQCDKWHCYLPLQRIVAPATAAWGKGHPRSVTRRPPARPRVRAGHCEQRHDADGGAARTRTRGSHCDNDTTQTEAPQAPAPAEFTLAGTAPAAGPTVRPPARAGGRCRHCCRSPRRRSGAVVAGLACASITARMRASSMPPRASKRSSTCRCGAVTTQISS